MILGDATELILRRLMISYQAGDLASFEELHRLLSPELSRYLGSLAGPRAGDLTQEAFLQIHRARRTYDPSQPFRPWAFAIAKHVFLMDRRGHSRRERRESAIAIEKPSDPTGPFERSLVTQLLSRVSEECRTLLDLRYFEGLSFEEAAQRMGLAAGAARVRASRALAQMRRALEQA